MNVFEFDAHALRQIAGSVNPLLTVLLIGAIFWRRRVDARFPMARFALCALLAIVASVILGRINEKLRLWPADLEFPSGHTCYAASVATSLCLLNRRWLFFVVPLLAAYGALIVHLKFHVWLDVIGAWVLMPPIAWAIHRTSPGNKLESKESP